MSDAYDSRRSPLARRKVFVTRLYEVECSECGIVDSRRSRRQAEEAAKDHRQRHRQSQKASR
jgi:hypothetical protein